MGKRWARYNLMIIAGGSWVISRDCRSFLALKKRSPIIGVLQKDLYQRLFKYIVWFCEKLKCSI